MAGAAAVASIFGTIVAVRGQAKARKAASAAAREEKEMARQEAANIEAETAENVRRARDKASKVEGESRARAAASGFGASGSIDLALDSMSAEHGRQIAWMAKSGASKARMAIMGGDMRSDAQDARADQLQSQMWGTVATGVGSGYTGGKDAGWWG